jgi:universal stress protein A
MNQIHPDLVGPRNSCARCTGGRSSCVEGRDQALKIGLTGLVRRLQPMSVMQAKETRRILVGVDFSAGSEAALEVAIDQAQASGGSIELIHVLELADAYPFGPTDIGYDGDSYRANAQARLDQRAAVVSARGIPCSTKIIEGTSPRAITGRARETGATLIVVGTQGRRGLAHLVLGSVAETVVRTASCPVLTVPYAQKAA